MEDNFRIQKTALTDRYILCSIVNLFNQTYTLPYVSTLNMYQYATLADGFRIQQTNDTFNPHIFVDQQEKILFYFLTSIIGSSDMTMIERLFQPYP